MYERLRNDFALEIANLDNHTIIKVLQALDSVSSKYDVKLKEMGLSVIEDELPRVVQMYLVCKKMSGLSDTTHWAQFLLFNNKNRQIVLIVD